MKIKYLILVLGILVLGCGSDDDSSSDRPDPNPFILETIIGSWAYDTVTVNGELFVYVHVEGCNKDLFQFYNEEGKVFEFEEDVILECEFCADCASSSTGLRWDLYGDFIDLYFGEQLVTTMEILELDENFVRYKRFFDVDDDGVIDELIVTGIPYDPYFEFD